MDKLLRALRAEVARDPFAERILVLPGLTAGHQLRRRLALGGTPWLNLRCATPGSLAEEAARAELDRRGLVAADPTMTLLLAAELLHRVPEAAAYFAGVADSPGTLRAIERSLADLRLYAIRPADLAPVIRDPAKAGALAGLLSAYEAELERRGWADPAEVFRIATAVVRHGAGPTYLLPSGLLAHGLEKTFLAAIPEARTVVLEQDQPDGPLVGTETKVHLFAAVAPAAEVREVLRRLLRAAARLQDAELLLAREEPYLQAAHDLAAQWGVPVTYAAGIPAAWTAPGRAAACLAGWLAEDFAARRLADGLGAGDLTPGREDTVSPQQIGRLLRRAAIGWGKERYEPGLRALLPSPTEDEPEEQARAEDRRTRVEAALSFVTGLLAAAPEADADGCISLAATSAWLARMVGDHAAVTGPADAAAREALVQRMELAARWATGAFPPRAAADRVLALTGDLRVGASGPRPGHLHVAAAAGGPASGRARTFVLGLDEGGFGGVGVSDPLLLDEERAALPAPLPTSVDLAGERLYRLGLNLTGLRGEVTFSYSTRDPVADRGQFPSPLLLQAHRLATGRPEATYGDLARSLGDPAGYTPRGESPPVDSDEAWLARLAAGPVLAAARAAVLAAFPALARGQRLLAARSAVALTPYDGQIAPDPDRLDPRRNPDLVLSASRLELLAQCPLAYFFRHVLGVAPTEEIARDPGRWLDPAQRGSLLHQVYRDFYDRLGGRPSGDPREEALVDQVCEEAIARMQAEVPPPGEAVLQRERAEILAAGRTFLACERADPDPGRPALFEVSFASVPIPLLAGGSLALHGRIDRIDRVGEHCYRVWDYKTGRAYDPGGTILGGSRLQPALYALAAEALLRQDGFDPAAEVAAAGYRFPTERGLGQTWVPEGDPVGATQAALADLLDLLRAGTLVAAGDERACRYCDFRDACDARAAVAMTAAVAEAGTEPRLDALTRLRSRG